MGDQSPGTPIPCSGGSWARGGLGGRCSACMHAWAHGAWEIGGNASCCSCMVAQPQGMDETQRIPLKRSPPFDESCSLPGPRWQRVAQCWQPAAFSHISRLRDRERKHDLAVTPHSRPSDWLLWRGVECRFKFGPDRPAPKSLNRSAFDAARRGLSIKANFDFRRSCLASRKISEK